MKKIMLGIALLGVLLFPFQVLASDEVVSQNLEEVLKAEEIDYDFSNYKETDKQIPIYLFRGSGCSFCNRFLTYISSIVDEYGKYFKVVSYEVWGNKANNNLMKKVADFLDETANGVPFIVIGDKVFAGYTSAYDEEIKTAITDLYNSKDKYDVFKKMEEAEKEKNKSTSNTSSTTVIVWNIVITGLAVAGILFYDHSQYQKLNDRLDKMEKVIEKSKSKK